MSFDVLKNRFYSYFDKYFDLIERLFNNSSNALTILGGSHILLDGYFKSKDAFDFPEEVAEYFNNEKILTQCVEYFISRISVLAELDEAYNQDDFEELIPILYYKLCFEELINTYYKELKENDFIDEINNKISYLNNLLKKGQFLTEIDEDDISLALETVSRDLDEEQLLSMVIFAIYNIYIRYENEVYESEDEDFDEQEDISLTDINLQISVTIGHMVKSVNKKLLSMKKSNILYKEILKYKQLVDKCLYLTEIKELNYNKLCTKLGFNFFVYSNLLTIFYLESLKLLGDDYKFLNIDDNEINKMNKLTKYIQLAGLLYFSNVFISEYDQLEQINNSNYVMLQQISEDKITLDEIENILYNISFKFFEFLELSFESIDEFLNYILEKLSHICNEYYV